MEERELILWPKRHLARQFNELRTAVGRLLAVDSNHREAARIGTTEALECIDRDDWERALELLQRAYAETAH